MLEMSARNPFSDIFYRRFFECILAGRLFKVKTVFESVRVDVNYQLPNGEFALMVACEIPDRIVRTRSRMIKLLLDQGSDITLKNHQGLTPFSWACKFDKIDIVQIFLDKSLLDIDLNSKDRNGDTALMHATRTKNSDLVKCVIDALLQFRLSVDVCNNFDVTPYLEAKRLGHNDIMTILKEEGQAGQFVQICPYLEDLHRINTSSRTPNTGSLPSPSICSLQSPNKSILQASNTCSLETPNTCSLETPNTSEAVNSATVPVEGVAIYEQKSFSTIKSTTTLTFDHEFDYQQRNSCDLDHKIAPKHSSIVEENDHIKNLTKSSEVRASVITSCQKDSGSHANVNTTFNHLNKDVKLNSHLNRSERGNGYGKSETMDVVLEEVGPYQEENKKGLKTHSPEDPHTVPNIQRPKGSKKEMESLLSNVREDTVDSFSSKLDDRIEVDSKFKSRTSSMHGGNSPTAEQNNRTSPTSRKSALSKSASRRKLINRSSSSFSQVTFNAPDKVITPLPEEEIENGKKEVNERNYGSVVEYEDIYSLCPEQKFCQQRNSVLDIRWMLALQAEQKGASYRLGTPYVSHRQFEKHDSTLSENSQHSNSGILPPQNFRPGIGNNDIGKPKRKVSVVQRRMSGFPPTSGLNH